MQTKEIRLRRIQNLAHEIMVEMNCGDEQKQSGPFRMVIDNLSRAIGELSDPSGEYSMDYIEEKVGLAHYEIFKNHKKVIFLSKFQLNPHNNRV